MKKNGFIVIHWLASVQDSFISLFVCCCFLFSVASVHYYEDLKQSLHHSDLRQDWMSLRGQIAKGLWGCMLLSDSPFHCSASHRAAYVMWHDTRIWWHCACSTQLRGSRQLSPLLSRKTCSARCFHSSLSSKCRCRLWVTSLLQQLLQAQAQEEISQQEMQTETKLQIMTDLFFCMTHRLTSDKLSKSIKMLSVMGKCKKMSI